MWKKIHIVAMEIITMKFTIRQVIARKIVREAASMGNRIVSGI
jgi:hypothetical protein